MTKAMQDKILKDLHRVFKGGYIRGNYAATRKVMTSLDNVQARMLMVGIPNNDKQHKLATYHEFGTFRMGQRHLPPRPFLARGHRLIYNELSFAMAQKVVKIIASGKLVTKAAVTRIMKEEGPHGAEFIRFNVMRGITPKLKPRTVKQKIKMRWPFPLTALVASGDMVQAVRAWVVRV